MFIVTMMDVNGHYYDMNVIDYDDIADVWNNREDFEHSGDSIIQVVPVSL